MKFINGKEIAQNIHNSLIDEVSYIQNELRITPKLVVIQVGDNAASSVYIKAKQNMAAKIGILSELIKFDDNISQAELLQTIDKLNKDKAVSGMIVQLPLPKHINVDTVTMAIDPFKDVDGFHPTNAGLLSIGNLDKALLPCTAFGVVHLIKHVCPDLMGLNALIIGRSNIVGKPVSLLLLNESCTVTMAHSKTRNLMELCQNQDIIVAATGFTNLLNEQHIPENSIIIDVGIHRQENGKLCGDIDQNAYNSDKDFHITPVPGGVGPMTIAFLMYNTVRATYLQQNIERQIKI